MELAGTGKAKPYKLVDWIYVVLGVGMVIFQMVSTQRMFQGTIGQQNIHLMLALLIVFLASYKKARRFRWVFFVFIAVSLLATIYVQFNMDQLETKAMVGAIGGFEIAIGLILVILPIVATYYAFGAPLTVIAVLFVAYVFLGQYVPGEAGHGGYTLDRIMIQLSIGLDSGVYGSFLQASLSYIFLLIVFGSVLEITGAVEFFMGVAKIVGQKVRGGVAQTAVVGSAMVGTVTGSPMANVAMVGVYTIPAMKAAGLHPNEAGAVEACASTGSQIMPPVMGAAAFIMASVLGVPYAQIMLIGFIPAILYFFGVFSYVFCLAGKRKLVPLQETINRKELLLRAPLFVVPLGLLMYFLISGYTVMLGAFWALISALGLSLLRKETRPSLRRTLDGLARGAEGGCGIAVTCSVLGLLTVTMTMTGLGLKLPSLLQALSGGSLIAALILCFFAAIILGAGLHTVAVYTIVAITIAPGLVAMGVPRIAAHFFILYAGVFSNVTPPVAMAALVSSSIAKSKYLPTCLTACKIAVPAFILPFAFIWLPPLLGTFTSPLIDILTLLSLAACIFVFCGVFTGCLYIPVNWVERGMLLISSAGFLAYAFTRQYLLILIAIVLVAAVIVWQVRRVRNKQGSINLSESLS